ncbi:protein PLANT CADMIUM RESISTANCE 7-like [Cryptomeria japonica]|uniref:protein PLANT CADMIUM RESISTANCE 7-like n=1 Tax=Cryptomeria japonica TaxID=3369 RepID=UPI0025ACF360|nr:protein PLANT CADMIUM RESISTANCE 7-like [Cryptomeria japonica]
MHQQQQYAYGGSPGYASAPPMQAPYPSQHTHPTSRWSTGLYDCGHDCCDSLLTCCCPCVTFGRVAEEVDHGRKSCCTHATIFTLLYLLGIGCLYSCHYRSKLRDQYHLPEEPCSDCCVHLCCPCCALCQEHRELKLREQNPSSGTVNPAMASPAASQFMYK